MLEEITGDYRGLPGISGNHRDFTGITRNQRENPGVNGDQRENPGVNGDQRENLVAVSLAALLFQFSFTFIFYPRYRLCQFLFFHKIIFLPTPNIERNKNNVISNVHDNLLLQIITSFRSMTSELDRREHAEGSL